MEGGQPGRPLPGAHQLRNEARAARRRLRQRGQPRRPRRAGEVVEGDPDEGVGLVHHQGLEVGQEVAATEEVDGQERVVHHQEPGPSRPLAGQLEEAPGLGSAPGVGAEAGVPGHPQGQEPAVPGMAHRGLGEVPRAGGLHPGAEPAEQAHRPLAGGFGLRGLEAPPAEVVRPPLQHLHPKVLSHRAAEPGGLDVQELVLQRLGMGGDHHRPVPGRGPGGGGEPVGQRLPDPGGGLGGQLSPVLQQTGHLQGQLALVGAVLEGGQLAGQGAFRPQEIGNPLRVVGHGQLAFPTGPTGRGPRGAGSRRLRSASRLTRVRSASGTRPR